MKFKKTFVKGWGKPQVFQSWTNRINQARTTGFDEKMGIYILY